MPSDTTKSQMLFMHVLLQKWLNYACSAAAAALRHACTHVKSAANMEVYAGKTIRKKMRPRMSDPPATVNSRPRCHQNKPAATAGSTNCTNCRQPKQDRKQFRDLLFAWDAHTKHSRIVKPTVLVTPRAALVIANPLVTYLLPAEGVATIHLSWQHNAAVLCSAVV